MKALLLALVISVSCISATPPDGGRRAVIVGIANYRHLPSTEQLRFSATDGQQMANLLGSRQLGTARITSLLDENATRTQIIDSIQAIRQDEARPDTLFFFFSGHAELDEGTGDLYLLPTDADRKHIASTGIAVRVLVDQLRSIKASHLVIFLDACHSGAALQGKGQQTMVKLPDVLKPSFSELNTFVANGNIMFVSSSTTESSWEDEEFNSGIFTRFVIKGLNGDADGMSDGKKDGHVTTDELYRYLMSTVPERARQLNKPNQDPIINPDFVHDLVLSEPSSKNSSTPLSNSADALNRLGSRALYNPELALMALVDISRSKSTFRDSELSADQDALRSAMDADQRHRRLSTLKEVLPEDLVNPFITSDGSLLVSCRDPSNVVVVSLATGATLRELPIAMPDATGQRRPTLELCAISVSQNNQFAVIEASADNGRARLSVIRLDPGPTPAIDTSTFSHAVFFGHYLAASVGSVIHLISTISWQEVSSMDVKRPITSLLSDPESNGLGIDTLFPQLSSKRLLTMEMFDESKLSFKPIATVSEDGACQSARDFLTCIRYNSFNVAGQLVRFQGGYCGNTCQLFSTGASTSSAGWHFLYRDLAAPATLHFGSAQKYELNSSIQLPESIVTARLLPDDTTIVLGNRGGIYRFNALRYFDCCALPIAEGELQAFVASSQGLSAAVIFQKGKSILQIFRFKQLLGKIALSFDSPVETMAWLNNNESLAMLTGKKTTIVTFRRNDYSKIASTANVDCGFPIATDLRHARFACVNDQTRTIQIRSLKSQVVEQELNQHLGPLQLLEFGPDTLAAAGAYPFRSQILTSVWNSTTGRLISQRKCASGSPEGKKDLAFIGGNFQLIHLESDAQIEVQDIFTCEARATWNLSAGAHVSRLAADSSSKIAFIETTNPRMTHYLNPFEKTEVIDQMELQFDRMSVSKDGDSIIGEVGGRLMMIPVKNEALIREATKSVRREFSPSECNEFYPSGNCPHLLVK